MTTVLARYGVAVLTRVLTLWLVSSSASAEMTFGERALHVAADRGDLTNV